MSKSNGWTLFELIIVLSIMMIIFFSSYPIFNIILDHNTIQLIEHDVIESIHIARQYASVSEDVYLTHTPLSKDWSLGILLMSKDHKVLHRWNWGKSNYKVFWYGFQSKDFLWFTKEIQHSTINGYFLITSPKQVKKLIVNRAGRIRVVKL